MSAIAGRYRVTLRAWLSGPRVHASLFALTAACVIGLAILKATGVEAGPLATLLKVILPFSFVGLSIVDFRASVAIAVFELVLGGAGGRWTEYGASLSGRIFLDGVVALRAASIVIADWRRGERTVLGRYGAHALVLAFLFPAIWMPIGLLNHNGAGNVFGDGNSFAYFAFAIVVITLVRRGDGEWFRNMFFAACATNGVANLLLILASASHLTNLRSLRDALHTRLEMGGVIGHMSNGDFRLFTGASLFLQVGLALAAWRLLARPRSYRYWLLCAVFCIDLVATYTRGLWAGGAAAFALIVVLGAPTLRRALTVSGVTAAGFAIAMLVSPAVGFSLSDYVFTRTASITSSYETNFPSAIVNPSFERSGGWELADSGTRSLQVRRVISKHRAGSHSLELTNASANEDDFAYENLSAKPRTRYEASAWISSSTALSADEGRGLFVWDAQDGLAFNIPIGRVGRGWKRLAITFKTGPRAHDMQLRLYAPRGRVYWDSVAFAVSARRTGETTPAPVPPQLAINSAKTGTGNSDVEGQVSNGYRVRQAKSLFRHIRKHPLVGSGFGAIASDFGTGYRYELSYLDLLFKAGIVGLLLFLSFPLRLIWDALRLRFGRAEKARGRTPRGGAVVAAIIAGILLAGATNPYLFAAFGLFPILALVAWLEYSPVSGSSAGIEKSSPA
jgi:hypothetical protein